MPTHVYGKPATIPKWADTSTNITEPSDGEKDAGWAVGQVHPSSYENWKSKSVGDWIKWIDERFADGGTIDITKFNGILDVDATNFGTSQSVTAFFARGKGPLGYGAIISGQSATAPGNGGVAIRAQGGNANTNGSGGQGLYAIGGNGIGVGVGGAGANCVGGNQGGPGIIAQAGIGGYGADIRGQLSAPERAPLRVGPQDADPTSGQTGAWMTTGAAHPDGVSGVPKFYQTGAWRYNAGHIWGYVSCDGAGGANLEAGLGVSGVSILSSKLVVDWTNQAFTHSKSMVIHAQLQNSTSGTRWAVVTSQTTTGCEVMVWDTGVGWLDLTSGGVAVNIGVLVHGY